MTDHHQRFSTSEVSVGCRLQEHRQRVVIGKSEHVTQETNLARRQSSQICSLCLSPYQLTSLTPDHLSSVPPNLPTTSLQL